VAQTLLNDVTAWLNPFVKTEVWMEIGWILAKIVFYIAAGRLFIGIIGRAAKHIFQDRNQRLTVPMRIDQRRAQTIGRLVKNIVSYTVNFIVILMILSELGVNLLPLIAGAGVLGLAIGFGAQSLVKDIITGFFIIFEDQFGVGDVIKTGNFQGTVEEIGLRVTKIKSWTGEVHIIPNGAITEVTNYSIHNSIGYIDVSIAYGTDLHKALDVLKQTVHLEFEQNEQVLKEPEVLGVQTISMSEVMIRITFECKPMTHHGVTRRLNAAIKLALEKAGIETHPTRK
jgi:small-conductance mechanosensitive channel